MNESLIRILIIDDDESVLMNLQMFLIDEGFSVQTAPNGSKALEFLEQNPIDMCLVDLMMPEMNGLELIPKIVKKYPKMKLLIITGSSYLSMPKRFLALGLKEETFFTKPILNMKEIVARIKHEFGVD